MSETVHINGSAIVLGGGKFDSRGKFVRKTTSAPQFSLQRGQSFNYDITIGDGGLLGGYVSWRYKVGTYEVVHNAYPGTVAAPLVSGTTEPVTT